MLPQKDRSEEEWEVLHYPESEWPERSMVYQEVVRLELPAGPPAAAGVRRTAEPGLGHSELRGRSGSL